MKELNGRGYLVTILASVAVGILAGSVKTEDSWVSGGIFLVGVLTVAIVCLILLSRIRFFQAIKKRGPHSLQ